MYNKCCYTFILTKNRTNLRQITPLLLLLIFSNHIIPIQLILLLYYIIDSYSQYIIEVKRRCNCRSMNCFQIGQRQMSTNDMLINIIKHVCSNHNHSYNVYF